MNHIKQKLLAKKEESCMEQEINDKTEKAKEEIRQKGWAVLQWVVTIIYFVLLIYFVFRPLTEFMFMIEYNIKAGLVKYFIH